MRTPDLAYRDAALSLIRTIPDYRSLNYLELGCGDGFILEALHRDGVQHARGTTFRAKDADYIRTREHPEYLQVDYGIDLNRRLPYEDAAFDVVYSTEVVEHVEGHRNFFLEAARVLRPGGRLVLTTPNLHRILSRVNFALSGIHLTKQTLIPWMHPPERMEEFHHRCIEFPVMHWLLYKGGLHIEQIRTTEVHRSSRWALALRPLLKWPTRQQVMRHAREDDRQLREDLLKWMLSRPLLCSEQICLMARKQA